MCYHHLRVQGVVHSINHPSHSMLSQGTGTCLVSFACVVSIPILLQHGWVNGIVNSLVSASSYDMLEMEHWDSSSFHET